MLFKQLQCYVTTISRPGDLKPVFSQVAQICREYIGYKLLTITAINPPSEQQKQTITRLWSSHENDYPTGGLKDLDCDEWSEIVIRRQQAMICSSSDEIVRAFSDHAKIAGLGCESGINLPIILHGKVLGTLNIFHEANWLTAERIQHANALTSLLYAPMLLASRPSGSGPLSPTSPANQPL